MKQVLVIGSPQRVDELKALNWSNCQFDLFEGTGLDELSAKISAYDVVMDLNLDDQPLRINTYRAFEGVLMVSAVRVQLAEFSAMLEGQFNGVLVGMNCLPTFINRPVIELSLLNDSDADTLSELMASLEQDYQLVEDRVGMVTPRILFMIMNEACYTLQEGTANVADIDTGMKLGTSFPLGPFEWAEKVGVDELYLTLEAIYEDTKDERYKICPLLKTKYLKDEAFLMA